MGCTRGIRHWFAYPGWVGTSSPTCVRCEAPNPNYRIDDDPRRGTSLGLCISRSPESGSMCVLPSTEAAHEAGHESKRINGLRVCWGTTDDDRARWARW